MVFISIEKASTESENPNLTIYFKHNKFSVKSIVELLNSIEALSYLSLFDTSQKIKKNFPGVEEHSVSYIKLKEFGLEEDYRFLERFEEHLEQGYNRHIDEQYFTRKPISIITEPLNEKMYFFKKQIECKYFEKLDFDSNEFLTWMRTRTHARLLINKIQTGNSLEIVLDLSEIIAILVLSADYPIIETLVDSFINRISEAVRERGLINRKSPGTILVNSFKSEKEEKVMISATSDKKVDIKITFNTTKSGGSNVKSLEIHKK